MIKRQRLSILGTTAILAASGVAIAQTAFTGGFSASTITGAYATSLGVSPSGHQWAIGLGIEAAGGWPVYQTADDGFHVISGAQGTLVTSDPLGNGWVVNAQNTIYEWTGSTFAAMSAQPPCASVPIGSIAVASASNVWIAGCTGANDIWRFDGTSWAKQAVQGTEVAVSLDGTPWVIDPSRVVLRGGSNGTFTPLAGSCAYSISSTGTNYPWAVGCFGAIPYGLYEWDGTTFVQQYDGHAVRVAVGGGNPVNRRLPDGGPTQDGAGNVLFLDNSNAIHSLTTTDWFPGSSTCIASATVGVKPPTTCNETTRVPSPPGYTGSAACPAAFPLTFVSAGADWHLSVEAQNTLSATDCANTTFTIESWAFDDGISGWFPWDRRDTIGGTGANCSNPNVFVEVREGSLAGGIIAEAVTTHPFTGAEPTVQPVVVTLTPEQGCTQ